MNRSGKLNIIFFAIVVMISGNLVSTLALLDEAFILDNSSAVIAGASS